MTEVTLEELVRIAYSEDLSISQEQRDEACQIILDQQKETSIDFLSKLIELIMSSSDQKICTQYLLLLYSTIIHTQKFMTIDNFNEVFSLIQSVFLYIQNMDNIQENIKDDIAIVFGIIIGEGFQLNKENTGPQQYVLELIQEGEISIDRIYIVLREMIIWTESILSFSVDRIMEILSCNTSYNQKIRLFSTVAAYIPDDQQINEYFNAIIQEVTYETSAATFGELVYTCEISPHFFGAHFDEFIPLICSSISEGNQQTQINAIEFLNNLVTYGRMMCCSEQFFIPIITALMQLISNVDEDEPLNIKVEDPTPYSSAVQCLWNLVTKISTTSEIDEKINEIVDEFYINKESDNKIAASCILSISCTASVIFEKDALRITDIFTNSDNPRLIYAALALLKTRSKNGAFKKYISHDILSYVLELAISDEIIYDIRNMALKVIKTISNSSAFSLTDQLIELLISKIGDVFEEKVLLLFTYALEGNFRLCENPSNYFVDIYNIIEMLLKIEDYDIQIAAYNLFCTFMKRYPPDDKTDDLNELLFVGFQTCKEISESEEQLNPKTIIQSRKVFFSIFQILPIDIQETVAPDIIEKASEQLTIPIVVNEVESDVKLQSNSVVMVKSENCALQRYVDIYDYSTYSDLWNSIVEVINALSVELISGILPLITDLIQKYMENEARITLLDINVLCVFQSLFHKYGTEIPELLFEVFIEFLTFCLEDIERFNVYANASYNIMYELSIFDKQTEISKLFIEKTTTKLFEKIPLLIQRQIQINDLYRQQVESLNADDKEIYYYLDALKLVAETYEILITVNPALAATIYEKISENIISEYIKDETLNIPLSTLYLLHQALVCNEEWLADEGKDLLLQYVEEHNDDLGKAFGTMLYLVFAIRGNDFSDEFKLWLFDMIANLMMDVFDDSMRSAEDSLIYGCTQILLSLPSHFADPEIAERFIKILPTEYADKKNYIILLLMNYFFINGNESMKNTDNLVAWFKEIENFKDTEDIRPGITNMAVIITFNYLIKNDLVQELYENLQIYDRETNEMVGGYIKIYNQLIEQMQKKN